MRLFIALFSSFVIFGVMILARAIGNLEYEIDDDPEEMRKRTHIESSGSFSSPEGKSGSDNLMSSL